MDEGERILGVEERDDGGGGTQQQQTQLLWSWGAGTEGQLGTGTLQDHHFPQPLFHSPSSSTSPISFLACGGAHVVALTTGGKVLTWGRGTSGQLGHGDLVNSLHPKSLVFLQTHCVTHVSAGWSHSGFVSDVGRLFTCGDGSYGQLGHGDFSSHCLPVEVSYFSDNFVEQIACGMRHSLILLKGNRVYGSGSGKRGQLGVSKDKTATNLPQIALGLEDVDILGIYANGDHSAALTADGKLYTWGRGFCGDSDAYCPQRLPSSLQFIQAALGWNHALLLTGDGEVRMHGGNHHGVLSDPQKIRPAKQCSEDTERARLMKVTGLDEMKVVQIAAGAEHSALVTECGVIKTWGWGEHGQLGLGDTKDKTVPEKVNLDDSLFGDERVVTEVFCGSGFTCAVRTFSHFPEL